MASFNDLLKQKDFWIFLFILGWLLLNWPLLALADGLVVLRMPAILVYITTIWIVFILLMYLFDRGNSE